MTEINEIIAAELNVKPWQVEKTIDLKEEGATVPFIARYRKEMTGELNENFIRDIFERYEYLRELDKRKETVLKTIAEQGKLDEELEEKIRNCIKKTELEDLYLPFKPKRRTRAVKAREKGLEPLAELIKSKNEPDAGSIDLEKEAEKFVDPKKEVDTAEEALKGASDIIAEEIAEMADLRNAVRNFFATKGVFTSRIKDDFEEGSTKYEHYRNFEVPVRKISSHNMLALRRGENEGVLYLDLTFDRDEILRFINKKTVFAREKNVRDFIEAAAKDGFNRLMKNSLISEIRLEKKIEADVASIKVFEENLRALLLAAPAGMKPAMGIDPGFRTGCKVAIVSAEGKLLEHSTIYPHSGNVARAEASEILVDLIEKYGINLIAIGNGTASRETDEFLDGLTDYLPEEPIKAIVSEAGASVYSASDVAQEEFPDLDVSIRGAVSIARRLQDPLAELVKIDPKSIGVGQYQHDVDQSALKRKLDETVESCVNFVGVDVNTASKELLSYVSGLTPTAAKNIVSWRYENGAFRNRDQILKVAGIGSKTYEQAAGFLRIREADNPLDNTAVHPESYFIVERILKDEKIPENKISEFSGKFKDLDLKRYVTDSVGLPTLKDIIAELEKPGRDPREEFQYAKFDEKVKDIKDLREGMILEGIVTNVANFGAFVDIGVHQDGLVHVSELANRFVRNPAEVVSVGQIIQVKVLKIDEKLKRIGLSMKRAKE